MAVVQFGCLIYLVFLSLFASTDAVWDDSCGDNFYSSTGVLESPVSEDGKYPSRALCKWNITVPNGLVQVAMTHLDVEYQQDCQWDSLQFYDGHNGKLLRKLCGNSTDSFMGASNSVLVVFTSDCSIQRNGWTLQWTEQNCGGAVEAENGRLSLPTSIQMSAGKMTCVWDVLLPSGFVAIDVLQSNALYSTGCVGESLKFYDGFSLDLIDKHCGCGPKFIVGLSNSIRIVLTLKTENTAKPWALKWFDYHSLGKKSFNSDSSISEMATTIPTSDSESSTMSISSTLTHFSGVESSTTAPLPNSELSTTALLPDIESSTTAPFLDSEPSTTVPLPNSGLSTTVSLPDIESSTTVLLPNSEPSTTTILSTSKLSTKTPSSTTSKLLTNSITSKKSTTGRTSTTDSVTSTSYFKTTATFAATTSKAISMQPETDRQQTTVDQPAPTSQSIINKQSSSNNLITMNNDPSTIFTTETSNATQAAASNQSNADEESTEQTSAAHTEHDDTTSSYLSTTQSPLSEVTDGQQLDQNQLLTSGQSTISSQSVADIHSTTNGQLITNGQFKTNSQLATNDATFTNLSIDKATSHRPTIEEVTTNQSAFNDSTSFISVSQAENAVTDSGVTDSTLKYDQLNVTEEIVTTTHLSSTNNATSSPLVSESTAETSAKSSADTLDLDTSHLPITTQLPTSDFTASEFTREDVAQRSSQLADYTNLQPTATASHLASTTTNNDGAAATLSTIKESTSEYTALQTSDSNAAASEEMEISSNPTASLAVDEESMVNYEDYSVTPKTSTSYLETSESLSFEEENGELFEESQNCSKTIHSKEGSLMSPNVLEKYPDGTTCRWNIYIPSGKIALHISKSDAENSTSCDYDNLKFEDGYTGQRLALHCGRGESYVIGINNSISIIFAPNSSNYNEGFRLKWKAFLSDPISTQSDHSKRNANLLLSDAEPCGNIITGESGSLFSPLYPQLYPNNALCVWLITAPNAQTILLNITDFDIEESQGCVKDVFQVYDGYSNYTLVGYCGKGPRLVTGTSNSIKIVFSSDHEIAGRGWSLVWTSLQMTLP